MMKIDTKITKIIKDSEVISITNVGSHLWGMNHENSDVDYGLIYVAPSRNILRGNAFTESKQVEIGNNDWTIHELGKTVNMLMKGNVNYVWIVTSPLSLLSTLYIEELKKLYLNNMSANIYHNIKGLAKHNYKKYLVEGRLADGEPYSNLDKKRKIIIRTLKFGINLLDGNGIIYEPVEGEVNDNLVRQFMDNLENAYEHTSLPENPDREKYYDYLEDVRRYLCQRPLRDWHWSGDDSENSDSCVD